MGNSPTDMHTHDMLVFFLNHIVGPELAPPVHVYSSLPVLYNYGFLTLEILALEDTNYFYVEKNNFIIYIISE